MINIRVPQINSNDDYCTFRSWLVPDGAAVEPGATIAEVETSKSVVDIECESAGYIRHVALPGARLRLGDVIARVAASIEELNEPHMSTVPETSPNVVGDESFTLTRAAREMMLAEGIDELELRALGKKVIRVSDIQSLREAAHEQDEERVPKQQSAVARVVTQSHLSVPRAFVAVKVYCDRALVMLREQMQADGAVVGITELFIRVFAELFDEFPKFYGEWRDPDRWKRATAPHIGVTIDTGRGLAVPVIRDPRGKMLGEIADRLMDLQLKSMRGEFDGSDLEGGRLTLSLNTDEDVLFAVPIVMPKQVCIASIGALHTEWAWEGGCAQSHEYVQLGLSYDHRLINGYDAVLFLKAIKTRVESPSEFFRSVAPMEEAV